MNKLAEVQAPGFRLFLWPHRLLVLAPGFVSELHRHHAAQITVSPAQSVEFRTEETDWQRASAFVIPPDVPRAHRGGGTTAMLYLEAESRDWQRSEFRVRAGTSLLAWEPAASGLEVACEACRAGTAAAAERFCAAVLGETNSALGALDPRVLAAQACIAAQLDRTVHLVGLAREVYLSPGRFAHLFQQETGIPVRRYVLWRRLRLATEVALQGRSLTEAAHEAGFADAAHLSRTFRAMFGIAPSMLTHTARVVLLP